MNINYPGMEPIALMVTSLPERIHVKRHIVIHEGSGEILGAQTVVSFHTAEGGRRTVDLAHLTVL